jgi:hypothetical protein
MLHESSANPAHNCEDVALCFLPPPTDPAKTREKRGLRHQNEEGTVENEPK